MKILCLSYIDEQKFDRMSEGRAPAFIKECLAYDDDLRKNGHFVRLEGLQSARTAKTLRYRSGKVSVTDGPFAETKEQIGGILLLDTRNLDHATELMSKHPGIRVATFEMRPIDEQSIENINTAAPRTEK